MERRGRRQARVCVAPGVHAAAVEESGERRRVVNLRARREIELVGDDSELLLWPLRIGGAQARFLRQRCAPSPPCTP